MIIYLLHVLLFPILYAADAQEFPNCKTPLKIKYTELEHITMMEKMSYQEMHCATKERTSLQSVRLSTLSTPELYALKETTQAKRELAESNWIEKFNACCCQATCAGGITMSSGMLLGCLAPQFGLTIGPIKGCCLGGLIATPVCICLVCYYAQTHNTELHEAEEQSKNIERAIKAKEMTE